MLHLAELQTQISTTGSFNIMLGPLARPSAADGNSETVVGYNVVGQGNSTFTLGGGTSDSSISWGATTWTAPSDIRLKEDIKDEEIGLEFVNELRPVTYQWRKAKDVSSEMEDYDPNSEERVMNGKHNHGFIAQEVKEVIDRYNFKDGFGLWSESGKDKRQRIGESALIPIIVKAIQELSLEVKKLKGE